jgi:hypothetical protein
VGRDSSVGIATRYGQDDSGIEPHWGRDFPHLSRSPPSLIYYGYRVYFPRVKRLGHGVNHPPPSTAEVKERVELYVCSSYGPSWPLLEQTLLVNMSNIWNKETRRDRVNNKTRQFSFQLNTKSTLVFDHVVGLVSITRTPSLCNFLFLLLKINGPSPTYAVRINM